MRKLTLSMMVALLVLAVASPSLAVEVYFNGVRVSGLKNQQFRKCLVKFDSSGNVHITAKGYSVKRVGDGDAATSNPKGTSTPVKPGVNQQYFLFSQANRPGMAQYDIDVYINGKWARKVRNSEAQVVYPLGKHLKKGKNVIQFAATKNYAGKSRLSTSGTDKVRVFVGVGTKGGGTVNITTTLASFTAAADRTDNFGQEQTINIR